MIGGDAQGSGQRKLSSRRNSVTTEIGVVRKSSFSAKALVRRGWWVVLLFALLGAGGAEVYNVLVPPVFEADAQLFVAPVANPASPADLNQANQFSQGIVKSYADLVTSPTVMRSVISDLNLQDSPEDLATKVSATSPLGTVIINVSAQWGTPAMADGIANSAIKNVIQVISQLQNPSDPSASGVRIVSGGVSSQKQVAPRKLVDLLLGLIGGLVVGSLLLAIVEAVRPGRRDADPYIAGDGGRQRGDDR